MPKFGLLCLESSTCLSLEYDSLIGLFHGRNPCRGHNGLGSKDENSLLLERQLGIVVYDLAFWVFLEGKKKAHRRFVCDVHIFQNMPLRP